MQKLTIADTDFEDTKQIVEGQTIIGQIFINENNIIVLGLSVAEFNSIEIQLKTEFDKILGKYGVSNIFVAEEYELLNIISENSEVRELFDSNI